MAQKPMHDDDGSVCPMMREPCVNVCHKCKFWRQYPVVDDKGRQGTHWDCSLAFAGQVAVQQVGETAQATKAVQQLRNLTLDMGKVQLGAALYGDPEALSAAMNAIKLIEVKELARSQPQIA